jgi:hypothetical protein
VARTSVAEVQQQSLAGLSLQRGIRLAINFHPLPHALPQKTASSTSDGNGSKNGNNQGLKDFTLLANAAHLF